MGYADSTSVPVERSRLEIERLIVRFGAKQFASGWDARGASLLFEMKGRRVKFVLPIPDANDKAFTKDKRGYIRTEADRKKLHEQACRARWRALALCIRSKLASVEAGIESFEEAFLAHVVLPSGENVSEWAGPQIERYYTSGRMPQLETGDGEENRADARA